MRPMFYAVAMAAVLLPPGAALAGPYEGVPNPRYPDGTGNDQVERLNDAQLDQNYRGSWYYVNHAAPAPSVSYPPPAYGAVPPSYPPPPPGTMYPPPAYGAPVPPPPPVIGGE